MSITDRAVLIAEIDALAASLSKCFELIPPQARGNLISFAHGLGKLRKKMLKSQRHRHRGRALTKPSSQTKRVPKTTWATSMLELRRDRVVMKPSND